LSEKRKKRIHSKSVEECWGLLMGRETFYIKFFISIEFAAARDDDDDDDGVGVGEKEMMM
jgi:hypothetical protein